MAITKSKASTRRIRQKQLSSDKNWKPNTFLRILPIILLSTINWFLLRYVVQPLFGSNEYYIDEEFHVPQARRYCRAEFHKWDPKITTFPGLYLLSTVVLVPCMTIINSILSLIGVIGNDFLHNYDPCSLFALRAVNAVGAPACLYYAYHRCQLLLSQKENKKSMQNAEWSYIVLSMSVATFPIIYAPYSMIYYTDAWATSSVFLWYSYHLNKKTNLWIKTILGGFCVLCRQTNIAWLVFASIIDVCHCAEEFFPTIKNNASTFSYIQVLVAELYNCCRVKKKNNKTIKLINFLKKCWRSTYSNIIVIGTFVTFIVLFNNGQIVIGDQQAHTPRFHPMQLCYFMVFVLGFTMPWSLSQTYFKLQTSKSTTIYLKITKILNQIQNISNVILMVILLTVTSGIVYLNTIAHPYLLSDNRHYTFYVWRLLFSSNKSIFLRYLPVPLYVYSLYFMNLKLKQSSIVYKSAYWIVTPLILCGQFLLEPRYFVVPYLMYRLHTNINNINSYALKAAFVEFISYQIINIGIMWIFLFRPFISTMDNTGRLDRFTW